MAGETQKSTALTNRNNGKYREARDNGGRARKGSDHHQFAAATELEAGDNLILEIPLKSNCIVDKIEHQNDDMDTGGGPTLVVDFGLAAREDFTSITSGTATDHSEDDILDADILVDGSTAFQAATTSLTDAPMVTDAADRGKKLYELLGYDEDPMTTFNVVLQSQAASSALASAADCYVVVHYRED